MNTGQFPPFLLARAAALAAAGRVHTVVMPEHTAPEYDDGFRSFRKICVTTGPERQHRPGARFTVTFRFSRFSLATNRILSLIPIPLIIAQPGFRSKTWLDNPRHGLFRGDYEWDSVKDALAYWHSFPMSLMKRRAVPGSLSYDVIPL